MARPIDSTDAVALDSASDATAEAIATISEMFAVRGNGRRDDRDDSDGPLVAVCDDRDGHVVAVCDGRGNFLIVSWRAIPSDCNGLS